MAVCTIKKVHHSLYVQILWGLNWEPDSLGVVCSSTVMLAITSSCAGNGSVLIWRFQWLGPAQSMSAKPSTLTMHSVVLHHLAVPQPVTITPYLIQAEIEIRKETRAILHSCTHC